MTKLGFPTISEYREAIQDPNSAFADPELRHCQPDLDDFGLPRLRSGGFACTFHLVNSVSKAEWAVRCFTRAAPDIEERYRYISEYLNARCSNLRKHPFVRFEYQPRGIQVNGQWFPILKMQWIHGRTLGSEVATCVASHDSSTRDYLATLRDRFAELALQLEELGVAHGDLADDNILVPGSTHPSARADHIVLVDYDGMYVPGMPMTRSYQLGHPGYQHPGRLPEHFGPYLDRFSAAVLYVALDALSLDPSLYERRTSGETLLFGSEDLCDPEKSPLFRTLEELYSKQPIERYRVWRNFRMILRLPFEHVPAFSRFLAARMATVPAREVAFPLQSTYPIVDARDRSTLLQLEGSIVEVRGTVTSVVSWTTDDDRPCLFVNFGNYYDGDFYLAIWSEALEELAARNWSVERLRRELLKALVSVTGVVQTYAHWGPSGEVVNPQMHYDRPGQLVILRPPQRGGNVVI